ncbi:MAG: serine/threonine-protein kinase [Gemmatimonadaceae bacterium]
MELKRGVQVGRYCIVAPLGHGGMGSVFRATDANLGRDVAIKVVTDSLAANDDAMRRFDSEARLLASVNHPNIASIYGLEEHDGQKYIVLELVGGETLAERIARGPLPLHEALDIVRQITFGLEAAHAHGIVHRDIKPANIKITEEGTVKVLDFGLAKTLEVAAIVSQDSDTALLNRTAAGVIVGTPMYMSPEQLRGEDLDARSDVWATGCVLFEALTGKQAFHASTYSGLAAAIIHCRSTPAAGRVLTPDRFPR